MANPICPQCNQPTIKHGKTASGTQRYRCKACNATIAPSDLPKGRKPISEVPMTGAERFQRWKQSDPDAKQKRNEQQRRRRSNKKQG